MISKLLPFRVVRKRRLPKKERVLTLTHFYTFPTGEDIYLYQVADLVKISGRYIDKIKSDIAFLLEYGATRMTVEVYEDKCIDLIKDAINNRLSHGEALAKLLNLFEERKKLFSFNRDLNEQLWLDFYCMMFVLDTEDELKWTPAQNDKKITLLKALPVEEQEFFFATLEQLMINCSDIYKADIAKYTSQKNKELNDLLSIDRMTNIQNLLSKLADGQERT